MGSFFVGLPTSPESGAAPELSIYELPYLDYRNRPTVTITPPCLSSAPQNNTAATPYPPSAPPHPSYSTPPSPLLLFCLSCSFITAASVLNNLRTIVDMKPMEQRCAAKDDDVIVDDGWPSDSSRRRRRYSAVGQRIPLSFPGAPPFQPSHPEHTTCSIIRQRCAYG